MISDDLDTKNLVEVTSHNIKDGLKVWCRTGLNRGPWRLGEMKKLSRDRWAFVAIDPWPSGHSCDGQVNGNRGWWNSPLPFRMEYPAFMYEKPIRQKTGFGLFIERVAPLEKYL